MANPHPNTDNLVKYQKGDTKDKAENGRKGGQATAGIYKQRKDLRLIFTELGNLPVEKTPFAQMLQNIGVDIKDKTLIEALIHAYPYKVFNKKEPAKAIADFLNTYAKYTGQEPAQKHELTGADGQPLVKYIEPQQYKEVQDHIDQFIGDTNDD